MTTAKTESLRRIPQFARLALMTVAAVAGSYGIAQAGTIYSFTGGSDGHLPVAALIEIDGSFYGTAFQGGVGSCNDSGTPGCGVVFKLSPAAGGAWQESVAYNFTFANGDGAYPQAPLTSDASNNLYGTANGGNTACGFYGCGVVYELKAQSGGSYTESILYSFTGGSDGFYPNNGVIFGTDGALYGTAVNTQYASGFGFGCGTIFRLGPPAVAGGPWSFSLLYSFKSTGDGCSPNSLVFGANGALYGTTGDLASATAFELAPPVTAGGSWRFTTLHTFNGTNHDGITPYGGVVYGVGGALYGSTSSGGKHSGGAIYQIAPPVTGGTTWTESVIYSFPAGSEPMGSLALGANGLLIGVAYTGGPTFYGQLFSLRPPTAVGANWAFSVIHNFTGSGGDGDFPRAGVFIATKGQIYGTTPGGGTGTNNCGPNFPFQIPGCGTVYMYNP